MPTDPTTDPLRSACRVPLHFQEEVARCGRDVIPIVGAPEIENGLDPAVPPEPLVVA